MVEVKELKPHPDNPNHHSKQQIERLAEIIEATGWRRPIRVSELSDYVTAGHGALMAAKKLKCEKVPVDYQDYENSDYEYADMVADNALHQWIDCGLDLGDINAHLGALGPDLDVNIMGLENFEIEIADKFNTVEEESEQIEHKPFKKVTCPECGHIWDANAID